MTRSGRSAGRWAVGGGLVAVCLWLLAAPAAARDALSATTTAPPDTARDAAMLLGDAIVRHAEGEPGAIAAWAEISSSLSSRCLEPAHEVTEDALARGTPGAPVALAAFYAALTLERARPPEVDRLTERARRRAEEWLERLETGGEDDAALRIRLLLAVGVYDIDRVEAPERARELLEETVDRAPRFADDDALATALYWLGTTQAMLGESRDAAESFERLATLRRDDAEAWLKLGVSRAGEGEIAAARDALERALTTRSPSWARVLAYQELAHLVRRHGASSRAALEAEASVLARGLAEFPFERGLQHLELARLEARPSLAPADRARRDALIEALAAPATEPSVRLRYDHPTRDGLRRAREALTQRLAPLIPQLRESLDRIPTILHARRLERSCL